MGDDFDESYNSLKPAPGSSSNIASRPEELDEVSHADSAHSGATHLMSNRLPNAPLKSKAPLNEAAINGHTQETYGEEEESITNIFKSLSEIQTRLASKGKPLPGDALSDDGSLADRSKANTYVNDMYAFNYQPPIGPGWGKEGIVEDASIDGSQFSHLATSTARNRHPQQGQWMEPVDEVA